MGIFKRALGMARMEAKKAMAPKGTASFYGRSIPLYVDDESVPKDLETVKWMMLYYNDMQCKIADKKEIRKKIVKRAYEYVKNNEMEDPKKEIELEYFHLFGNPEELAMADFDELIRGTKDAYHRKDELNNREQNNYKKIVYDGFLDSKLKYNNQCTIKRIPELADAIWQLVEMEKQEDSLCYTGYYMYKDFISYFKNDAVKEKGLHVKMWSQARKYTFKANTVHDRLEWAKRVKEKRLIQSYSEAIEPLTQMNKEAQNNIHNLSKQPLMDACSRFVKLYDDFTQAQILFASKEENDKLNGGLVLAFMGKEGFEEANATLLSYFENNEYEKTKFRLARKIIKENAGDKVVMDKIEAYVWNMYSDDMLLLQAALDYQGIDDKEYLYLLEAASKSGNAQAKQMLSQTSALKEDVRMKNEKDVNQSAISSKMSQEQLDEEIDALFDMFS